MWDETETNAQKVDALKWKAKPSGRAVIEELDMPTPPSKSLDQQYESLEKLLDAVQPLADTPSSGAHFRLLVTPNKQGWAKCVRATSVAAGDMFVSCGSGSRMDPEQAQRKMPDHSGFLCKLTSDNMLVGYRKETLMLTTLYNLHAQITLEGHPRVELSYHQLRPKSGNQGLDRFDVEIKRQRYWVCAKPQSDANSIRWDNILRLVDTSGIPNDMVQLVWELKKDMTGGIASLIFERPF